MRTCKDCLHLNVCGYRRTMGISDGYAEECGEFVEKSDISVSYITKYTVHVDMKNVSVFIMSRKEIYEQLFHEPPNYVKMPKWIYRRMIEENDRVIVLGGGKYLICGLIVCPTISIDSIAEIEVF